MFTRRKDEYDVFAGFGRYGLIWTNEDLWAEEIERTGRAEGAEGAEGAERAEAVGGGRAVPTERDLIGGLRASPAPARRAGPGRPRRGLLPVAALLALCAAAGALAIGRDEPATRVAADRARNAPAPAPAPVAAPAVSARPAPPARAPSAPRGARGKVVLLDQTKVPTLAERMARRLEAAGWEVSGTDVFRGAVPATTVYHPVGQERQARALAAALPGIGRIKPAFAGIPLHRLTVIVVDDQVVPPADRLLGSLTTG
ncbi:LytR C-terminal domain-containing protein [Embleya sp. NPDC127516]|uniref:LytR C-terminal domain-containing protein n=1 Tax=Embleya sp. NPDC127516 TaxID=3363990 RepID=UPI003811E289